MKKNFLLLCTSLLASVAFTNAQDFVLTPTQDASVGFDTNTNSANNNYNGDHLYAAFSQPGVSGGENAGRGLMKFDLSAIPQGTVIADARLDLYGSGPVGGSYVGDTGSMGFNKCILQRITSTWQDNTVTFNTQPTVTKRNHVILHKSTSVDQDYLNIDVTAMVQDMINHPNKSFGFRLMLKYEQPTAGLLFWSTDGAPTPDKYPTLRITLGLKNQLPANAPINSQNLTSKVAPNPFHNSTEISFVSDLTNRKAELRVYNLFGQMVETLDVSGKSSVTIERNNLSEGLYHFVVITNEAILESGKFVIE